jgi:hypothetical protein
MPDFDELYRKHNERMEDFWSRRVNAPKFQKTIHVFGYPILFDSNHEKVLEAAIFAEEMYSVWAVQNEVSWRVHLTARSGLETTPAPERLVDYLSYTGAEDWISIDLREWGNCLVDMRRGEAYVILSSSLAKNPKLVCQLFINTILNNILTRHGYSMIHASALIKDDHLLILQAPHGTGKSTTALRLLLNGYKLVSDSQIYVGEHNEELWMGGFPVGRIKLRTDMLSLFPGLSAEVEIEYIRNEIKHRVELKRVDSALTYQDMIRIHHAEFCLLERWDRSESKIESASEDEVWQAMMVNSLHYDTPEIWRENLHRIELLLKRANLHRLRIGTSEDEIIKTVNSLW